jgi:hypothetical protein
MILVNGDSFTAGEESTIAWPSLIPGTINIAAPGASNDYICRATVNYIENSNDVDAVIIVWTSPNRLELSNRHLTPSSTRKYGHVVDAVFHNWDQSWAKNKFISQVRLMTGYLKFKNLPFLFLSSFDIQKLYAQNECAMPTEYLGWPYEGIVEWMGDCSKGPGGHPLEQGHKKIALKIHEHIRNLGWVS